DPADDGHPTGFPSSGFISVRQIVFSDQAPWPRPAPGRSVPENESSSGELKDTLRAAIQNWSLAGGPLSGTHARLLNRLVQRQLLDAASSVEAVRLATEYTAVE